MHPKRDIFIHPLKVTKNCLMKQKLFHCPLLHLYTNFSTLSVQLFVCLFVGLSVWTPMSVQLFVCPFVGLCVWTPINIFAYLMQMAPLAPKSASFYNFQRFSKSAIFKTQFQLQFLWIRGTQQL